MDASPVVIRVDGPIATVRLSRAEKRNAMSETMVLALESFFADPPPDVRVALLSAEGEHFCAGLDLAQQQRRTPFETMEHSRLWHRAFDRIEHGRVPVVAALHGAVIGGGLELALAAHVRVAAPSTFYAMPEGGLGIFVGGGGSVRIGRILGPDRLRELMLTGRRLAAADGQRLGLSHELTDSEDAVNTRARELAERIATNAPLTNQLMLTALPHIGDMSRGDGFWAEALTAALTAASEDAHEGLQAFLDKRPPEFRGR
jgi:enoyl-CoA hydratase/carnithine racemase